MLRVHFMQQWLTLSDTVMEEALHDMPLFREFAGLNWDTGVPDETTIRFVDCWKSTSQPHGFLRWSTSYWMPRACCGRARS